MKLNIFNNRDLVSSVDILSSDANLDLETYSAIINRIRQKSIYDNIVVEFDEPLYFIIKYNEDYALYMEDGRDFINFLPKDGTIMDCPSTSIPDACEPHVLYKIEGFKFTSEDISYDSLVKMKTKPNKRTETEYKCRLIDNVTVSVIKYTYGVYFNKIKELEKIDRYKRTISKRESDLLKKLTPIISELNKPENLVLPYVGDVMNCVQVEFNKDKITGKLFRNRKQHTCYDYWREKSKDLLMNLTELPKVYDKSYVMNYDTNGPTSIDHGSICPGEVFNSLEEFKDALRITLLYDETCN